MRLRNSPVGAPRAFPAAKRARVVARVLSSPPTTRRSAPAAANPPPASAEPQSVANQDGPLERLLKSWRWPILAPEPASAEVQQVRVLVVVLDVTSGSVGSCGDATEGQLSSSSRLSKL